MAEVRLDMTHRWGQRPIYERVESGGNLLRERKIPCCLNCLVDGYEDEAAALEPCRRQDNPAPTALTTADPKEIR